MPEMKIFIDGDGAIADLSGRPMIHLGNDAPPIRVMALKGGMRSGRTSVAIVIELPPPERRVVAAETSLRLFQMAAVAFTAKYGNETEAAVNFLVAPDAKASITFNDEIENEAGFWENLRGEYAQGVRDALRWILKRGPRPSQKPAEEPS